MHDRKTQTVSIQLTPHALLLAGVITDARCAATVPGTRHPCGAPTPLLKDTPMTILTNLAAAGTICAVILAVPAALYLFSRDTSRRTRALRLLRLLLRR